MAGCFGNSPFDRNMEQQLYAYLDAGADWDSFCEKISELIPTEEWDNGIEDWFDSKECDKILNDNYYQLPEVVAAIVVNEYKLKDNNEA